LLELVEADPCAAGLRDGAATNSIRPRADPKAQKRKAGQRGFSIPPKFGGVELQPRPYRVFELPSRAVRAGRSGSDGTCAAAPLRNLAGRHEPPSATPEMLLRRRPGHPRRGNNRNTARGRGAAKARHSALGRWGDLVFTKVGRSPGSFGLRWRPPNLRRVPDQRTPKVVVQ